MRKRILGVALAALLMSVNLNAASVTIATQDTISTQQREGAEVAKRAIGGLLGGFVKNAADKTNNKANDEKAPVNDDKNSNSNKGKGLGSFLGSIIGQATGSQLSVENLAGTWNYVSSKCVLESENVMKKMGGEMMVAPLEEKINKGLSRVGMKEGCYSYTFNTDGSFTSVVSGRTKRGSYTLDAENKTITFMYLGGLVKSTMDITMVNGKLGLLRDSDKLLTFLNAVSGKSNSMAVKSVNSILTSYDGLKIGLEFSKAK